MSSYKPREVVLKKDLPNLKETIVNDFRPQISAMQEQINLVKSLSQPKGNYIERKDIKLLSSTDLPLLASASSVGEISQLTKYNGQSLVYAINDISDNMVTKAEANSKYQPKGEYVGKSELSNYYTKTEADGKYQVKGEYAGKSELANYYTKTEADGKYQVKGEYQPKGEYAGKSELSNYYTKAEADGKFKDGASIETIVSEMVDPIMESYINPLTQTVNGLDAKYATREFVEDIAGKNMNSVNTRFQPKGEYALKSDYYNKQASDERYVTKDKVQSILDTGGVSPEVQMMINAMSTRINSLTTACSQVDDKIFLTDMMAKLSKINAEIDSRT